MTTFELTAFMASCIEDQDKTIKVDEIPERAKVTDLSMSDDGTNKCRLYYSGD